MSTLYISSIERWSGKTTIALAVVDAARKKGKSVTPMKPFSIVEPKPDKAVDESVLAICEHAKISEDMSRVCPILLKSQLWYIDYVQKFSRDDLIKKIVESYKYLSNKYDIVVVIGYKSVFHKILGKVTELEIARILNSKLLLVVKPSHEDVLGDVISAYEYAKSNNVEVVGVVFNMVKHHMLQKVRSDWTSILESLGLRVLGVIPEIPELYNPTIKDLAEELEAKVLTCEDKLNQTFETILIGAMTPETALRYMRATPGKLVVTGGDRADLIMAALETDTRAIILTGGVHPSARLLARAEEKGIPILMVNYDTFTTVSKILSMSGKLRPGDRRIDIVISKLRDYINLDEILRSLGA